MPNRRKTQDKKRERMPKGATRRTKSHAADSPRSTSPESSSGSERADLVQSLSVVVGTIQKVFSIEPAEVLDYKEEIPRRGLKDEGQLDDALQTLIERIRDRPDLVTACLKFLDSEITRPAFAKISAELTQKRLDKIREQQRLQKARSRARQKTAAKSQPVREP